MDRKDDVVTPIRTHRAELDLKMIYLKEWTSHVSTKTQVGANHVCIAARSPCRRQRDAF